MSAAQPVQRHRTAMVRHSLSQPMSLMVQHGVIHTGISVFDYGCGQGDDLRALATAGISAAGWDPHFYPDQSRHAADVVNLGFVLNVIEDEAERGEALVAAWSLATRALAVSTMIVGQVPTEGLKPYRDGYLTSRGTFQKYFSVPELRTLISDALGRAPVSAAPGIFFVFQTSEDEEEFLLRRRIGRRSSTLAYRAPRPRREAQLQPAASERVAEALVHLAELTQLRGRTPVVEEVPPDVLEQLASERVSLSRALDLMMEGPLSQSAFDTAAAAMREDLLVHYALARINRSSTADRPSPAMVRDVRAHFGSQREVMAAAMDYLMELADEQKVGGAVQEAAASGVAARDQKGRLLLDARASEALPGVLRVYLGCATYLAGEPDPDGLVRIDSQQRTVTYLPLDDRKAAFPSSSSATVVDLKRQTVRVHDTRRVLIARSKVLGKATRAQREAEATLRGERELGEAVLMIRTE